MESFYGGRQGTSFVLKGKFVYITDNKRQVGDSYEWIDPYYGEAYETWQLLSEYETWNAKTENQGKTVEDYEAELAQTTTDEKPHKKYLPRKRRADGSFIDTEVYTAEEWKNYIENNTMSIRFNDYEFKDIWYGEYCIIDPDNKNNVNNGKIFRRTLKGAGDDWITGGVAEYMGQIVGPAGLTPQLRDITGVDKNEANFQKEKTDWNTEIHFINQDGVWDISRNKDDHLYVKKLKVSKNGSGADGIRLIPGNTKGAGQSQLKNYFGEDDPVTTKDERAETYIQNGGYNWYDLRDQTPQNDISEIHLGFDFPYYVTETEAGDVLPDISPVEVVRQINTVDEPFEVAPFFEKYKINIPRGLRGAWFENIRSVTREADTPQSPHKYYNASAISYYLPRYKGIYTEPNDGVTNVPEKMDKKHYTNKNHYKEDGFTFANGDIVPEGDWPIGAKGWVATFCWRTKDKQNLVNNEDSVIHKVDNIFLGLDRYIEDITFDNDGTLVFKYSAWTEDNEQVAYTNRASQSGDTSIGNNTTKYQSWFKQVDWIKKVDLQDVYFNIGTNNENLNNDDAKIISESAFNNLSDAEKTKIVKTRTPKNLDITFNNKTVDFEGNNKTLDTYSKYLNLVAGIKMFKDGSVRIYHTGDTVTNSAHSNTQDFEKLINWITSLEVDNDDNLIINFNNNNIDQLNKNLRLIKDMILTDSGVLGIKQSDGTIRTSEHNIIPRENWQTKNNTVPLDLGSKINWIKKFHLVTGLEEDSFNTKANTNNQEDKIKSYHLLVQVNNEKEILPTAQRIYHKDKNGNKLDEYWFDLGLISNTVNGMFFEEDSIIIPYTENDLRALSQTYKNKEEKPQWAFGDKWLDENDKYKNGLNGKAIIATLHQTDTTDTNNDEKVIYYYSVGKDATGQEFHEWRVLKSFNTELSLNFIDLPTAASTTLSKPWNPTA